MQEPDYDEYGDTWGSSGAVFWIALGIVVMVGLCCGVLAALIW